MQRIEPRNVVVGVGVGVIDELVEQNDVKAGNTAPFKGANDWVRVGILAVALAGQAFNFMPQWAAPAAQSEMPLVVKTIGAAIRSKSTPASTQTARIRQTTKPGFEDIEVY